jgi:hypothetical protein
MLKYITLFIFFSCCFYYYESKCFYFGRNLVFILNKLPCDVTTKSNSYDDFSLLDSDGYDIVGKGFRYETTDFLTDSIISYGFDDSSIIIICTDSFKFLRHLISYETGNRNINGSIEISFKEISKGDFK